MEEYNPEETRYAMESLGTDYVNSLQAIIYADIMTQFNLIKEHRPFTEWPGIDFVIQELKTGVEQLIAALESD